MSERKLKKLPGHRHYFNKMLRATLVSLGILVFSLFFGVWGYHHFFGLDFYDSLINASMILTGMGPVTEAKSNPAKVFASIYAIYSGVAFLSSIAIIFGPMIHRFLHRFHLDIEE